MGSTYRIVLGLAVALLLLVRPAAAIIAVTETEEVAYVVNSYVHGDVTGTSPVWSTFTMLRGTTLAPFKTLTFGDNAHSVAVSPDGQLVWVTVEGAGLIEVIDTTSFEVIREIDTGDVGPSGVTISRDGLAAWVTYYHTGQVAIFNARTGRLLELLEVGGNPDFILFSPSGAKVYVIDELGTRVVVIQTAGPDGDVTAALPFVGHRLQDAAVSPDGTRLYVVNHDESQIEVIDTATDTALEAIPTDARPRSLGISPDGRYLFVGHNNPAGLPAPAAGLSMIRLSDGVLVASRSETGNFRRMAMRPDGTRLFLTDHDNDAAVAVDVVGEALRVARVEDLNTVPDQQASPVGVAIGQYPRPVPRVTINGLDGPVRLTRADSARLTLSLDTNGRTDDADWWLVCAAPTGTFYWTAASGWTRTARPGAQGALVRTSSSVPAVSLAGWATGTYVFGFAVDVKRDGFLSTRYAYTDLVTMVLSE